MKTGIVVRWFTQKKFGFIQLLDSPIEYFVHVRALVNVAELSAGQRVSFELGSFNQRECAVNVEVAQ
jgi:cold shock CspA family protein